MKYLDFFRTGPSQIAMTYALAFHSLVRFSFLKNVEKKGILAK